MAVRSSRGLLTRRTAEAGRSLVVTRRRALLPLGLLLLELLSVAILPQQGASEAHSAFPTGDAAPPALLAPPTDLAVVALDSTIHMTWTPSTDAGTAWHVASVWDGITLVGSKVVSRTGKAVQMNGLVPGHPYLVRVQAMDAAGGLSLPISLAMATDPQSPITNPAFFENFNGSPGDLDPNYFDVRTSHGTDLQPDSIGVEKMLVFNNENHFHTQLIGGKQRAELYIRPRAPFDFAGRTGTFQFEVDLAAVQRSPGKWFEIHLMAGDTIPWSSEEFGPGNGENLPGTMEFSVRQGQDTDASINVAQITVNLGGTVQRFEGTIRQITPGNIRVPVVLKVSQTSAEMLINGVSVAQASGFTLPFTRGYWMLAHRGWYASRDVTTTPIIVQLIHWDTIQYDGPAGSYNPVVRTALQPGCLGVVHNEHGAVLGCADLDMSASHRTQTVNLTVENAALARSARLLYNGFASETASLDVSVSGHVTTVPTHDCCFLNVLNSLDVPVAWLVPGTNQVTFTYPGSDVASVGQVELEVVYNEHRILANPSHMDPMPMLAVSAANFRVDHLAGDPTVWTATTNLYSMGSGLPINYQASVISTETPWLTVSPAQGLITSAALGGGVVPLTLRIDFTGVSTPGDGEVGIIKITGGNMPVYVGVLALAEPGATVHPTFIPSFTNLMTTFNKDAIPNYHGGTPCSSTFMDVPANHWAFQYVSYLACHTIVGGYPDGTFRPNNNVTRGQIAKILTLGEGWPINTSGGPHFGDVAMGSTFYEYVETAYHHGVLGGYPDGTFRPNTDATRGQLAKIVVLAEGWPVDTTAGPHFGDVAVGSTFYAVIETAFHKGIISGYPDGTFRPNTNTTRAQMSKIVYYALILP